MKGVEAAQLVGKSEFSGFFGQVLIYLEDVHRSPFVANELCCRFAGDESHRPDGFNEPNTTYEPTVGVVHSVKHEIAARFGDITLDQRT